MVALDPTFLSRSPKKPTSNILGCRLKDRYVVKARLCESGMSEVYTAYDSRLDRPVIIKLAPRLKNNHSDQWIERAKREALALSRLDHPRIVRLFDTGFIDEDYYLVLEHLCGKPLSALIEQGGFTVFDAVTIMLEILEAVEALHRAGMVHRDIKAHNVIVDEQRGCTLIDFGLVALYALGRSHRLTQEGYVFGSPGYMSPEQCRGTIDLHPSMDIYVCGVMLYELIAGPPFPKENLVSLLAAHCSEDPPPFSKTAPHLAGSRLEAVAMRALQKSPSDRFQTAADMSAALAAAITPP